MMYDSYCFNTIILKTEFFIFWTRSMVKKRDAENKRWWLTKKKNFGIFIYNTILYIISYMCALKIQMFSIS